MLAKVSTRVFATLFSFGIVVALTAPRPTYAIDPGGDKKAFEEREAAKSEPIREPVAELPHPNTPTDTTTRVIDQPTDEQRAKQAEAEALGKGLHGGTLSDQSAIEAHERRAREQTMQEYSAAQMIAGIPNVAPAVNTEEGKKEAEAMAKRWADIGAAYKESDAQKALKVEGDTYTAKQMLDLAVMAPTALQTPDGAKLYEQWLDRQKDGLARAQRLGNAEQYEKILHNVNLVNLAATGTAFDSRQMDLKEAIGKGNYLQAESLIREMNGKVPYPTSLKQSDINLALLAAEQVRKGNVVGLAPTLTGAGLPVPNPLEQWKAPAQSLSESRPTTPTTPSVPAQNQPAPWDTMVPPTSSLPSVPLARVQSFDYQATAIDRTVLYGGQEYKRTTFTPQNPDKCPAGVNCINIDTPVSGGHSQVYAVDQRGKYDYVKPIGEISRPINSKKLKIVNGRVYAE